VKRRPIATVTACEAFKILADGFRFNPYRLALLRRIYVGRFSHSEVPCPRPSSSPPSPSPVSKRRPSSRRR
jgi:hypothetical protein